MDEEENTRRGGAVGHPLAQPVSIPATNGLRYNTQQPAMQEVPPNNLNSRPNALD
ncbi:MesA [Aspergillus luchuensis]|uniref:MesA n=1 Tax=Aspergillus kawachii TaxID=1069201 RepID=A0A146FEG7_ASPKA|nr:MesA [Aspergillus luchuensis]